MRYTVTLFLLFLVSPGAFAQQQTDYNKGDYKEVMAQLMAFYNANDASGFNSLFSDRSHDNGRFTRGRILALKDKYREMESYRFARTREDGIVVFRVSYAKYRGKYPDENEKYHAGWVGFTLDNNKKILRLRFPTTAYTGDGQRYLLRTR